MTMSKTEPNTPTIPIRINVIDMNEIDKIMKNNPVFRTPAEVIHHALGILVRLEAKK